MPGDLALTQGVEVHDLFHDAEPSPVRGLITPMGGLSITCRFREAACRFAETRNYTTAQAKCAVAGSRVSFTSRGIPLESARETAGAGP